MWSAPHPSRFTPEKEPGTHFIAGCVDLRASLDCCGKPRFFTRFRTPDCPTLSQLLFQPRYPGLHVGRIHRSYSITLKIEAGCYSEVLILQFIIWEFGRRMDKPCSGVCYVFFFSYLLLLRLSVKHCNYQKCSRRESTMTDCGRGVTVRFVWAGHAQCA